MIVFLLDLPFLWYSFYTVCNKIVTIKIEYFIFHKSFRSIKLPALSAEYKSAYLQLISLNIPSKIIFFMYNVFCAPGTVIAKNEYTYIQTLHILFIHFILSVWIPVTDIIFSRPCFFFWLNFTTACVQLTEKFS